ncbi:hypothetical protein GCM10007028_25870 [Algibacter mikhailovii]|uniref:Uncharacterized protein n=1 Tax=Algibacter mikhailovii TaxID=425498 RepID=A0A918R5J5_9FLAO|nr:hypothetical protein GCM10007028_25870 [Algibacter mikhailovii]
MRLEYTFLEVKEIPRQPIPQLLVCKLLWSQGIPNNVIPDDTFKTLDPVKNKLVKQLNTLGLNLPY